MYNKSFIATVGGFVDDYGTKKVWKKLMFKFDQWSKLYFSLNAQPNIQILNRL